MQALIESPYPEAPVALGLALQPELWPRNSGEVFAAKRHCFPGILVAADHYFVWTSDCDDAKGRNPILSTSTTPIPTPAPTPTMRLLFEVAGAAGCAGTEADDSTGSIVAGVSGAEDVDEVDVVVGVDEVAVVEEVAEVITVEIYDVDEDIVLELVEDTVELELETGFGLM